MLTPAIVAFLMEAVVAGRLDRHTAHLLVSPWVDGDERAAPGSLGGATILHGLDLVSGDAPGTVRHATSGEDLFIDPDEEVVARCSQWLDQWRASLGDA